MYISNLQFFYFSFFYIRKYAIPQLGLEYKIENIVLISGGFLPYSHITISTILFFFSGGGRSYLVSFPIYTIYLFQLMTIYIYIYIYILMWIAMDYNYINDNPKNISNNIFTVFKE